MTAQVLDDDLSQVLFDLGDFPPPKKRLVEVAAFAEAAELSRRLAERALSNEVVTPGVTTLEDVAWWMQERLLERGLGSSFDMPSVYVTGPKGIEAVSTRRIVQRGEILVIDWGVCLMNFCTDVKRMAYVLKPGEREVPAGFRNAFDKARDARAVIRRTIKAGPTAIEMLGAATVLCVDKTGTLTENRMALAEVLAEAGFSIIEFNKPKDGPQTDVVVGCHSVGNLGHGVGPSIAWFNPERLQYVIRPTNMFSIELFAYTKAPEFGGKKVRIPLEDDAIVTERGVEWFYPINRRILLVR